MTLTYVSDFSLAIRSFANRGVSQKRHLWTRYFRYRLLSSVGIPQILSIFCSLSTPSSVFDAPRRSLQPLSSKASPCKSSSLKSPLSRGSASASKVPQVSFSLRFIRRLWAFPSCSVTYFSLDVENREELSLDPTFQSSVIATLGFCFTIRRLRGLPSPRKAVFLTLESELRPISKADFEQYKTVKIWVFKMTWKIALMAYWGLGGHLLPIQFLNKYHCITMEGLPCF